MLLILDSTGFKYGYDDYESEASENELLSFAKHLPYMEVQIGSLIVTQPDFADLNLRGNSTNTTRCNTKRRSHRRVQPYVIPRRKKPSTATTSCENEITFAVYEKITVECPKKASDDGMDELSEYFNFMLNVKPKMSSLAESMYL